MAEIIDTADLNLSALNNDEGYWVYNGLDCCVTYDVFNELDAQCDDTARGIYEFSKSLQAPILEMNLRGLRVHKSKKLKVLQQLREQSARLEDQLQTLITEGIGIDPVNWRSPHQLKHLLYDVMQLPEQKKFANGRRTVTTDEGALEKLANYFIAEPICNHILSLRGLGKSISFLNTEVDNDGRMRTRFNIAGTNTGRFASSATDFGTGTNLQNVTAALRSVFVADPGMMFCNIDLEQADSRNVGALCWETLYDRDGWDERTAGAYLDACESGDLHTLVTKMASPDMGWGDGRSDREIADQIAHRHLSFRDLAKKLGHGSNYLGTPPTMAKHSRLPTKLAKEFQDNYFAAFPCIPEWHSSIFWQLENLGFLTSPFGRRRFFFGRPKEASTRREAVAYTPQSMTADEINRGILEMWRSERVQLLVQVHDSILFQFPEHLRDEIVPWAVKVLESARLTLKGGREFYVPAEAATGWNWGYGSEENPDGLKKWKGGDERKRQEKNFKLSLADF